jgi:PAS domain S-box-containing protein
LNETEGDLQLLRRIFEEANDAILLVDTSADQVIKANRRAWQLLGYQGAASSPVQVSSIFPDEMDRLESFMQSVAHHGKGWTDELECVTRGGLRVPTEISASLLEHDGRRCMLAVVRDISMRKSSQERFLTAYDRLRNDMEAAARIQKSLLPRVSPVVAGMRFAWEIFPCGELAGDTLNIFHLDRDRIGFFVLDVSGHGASAAMMSMAIHRLLAPSPGPPSVLFRRKPGGDGYKIAEPEDVCHDLNVHFQMGPDLAQYFTLIYGILDGRTGGVRLVTAGHCAPVYAPPGGEPREMTGNNFPIGFFPDVCYTTQNFTLEPGSRLYIYSDGLTEADNGDGEQFGRDRLLQAIHECRDESLRNSLTSLLGSMRGWSRNASLADDVSLLAFEVAPAERPPV